MFLNFSLDDPQTQIQSGIRTDLNKGVSAMKIAPFSESRNNKGKQSQA